MADLFQSFLASFSSFCASSDFVAFVFVGVCVCFASSAFLGLFFGKNK